MRYLLINEINFVGGNAQIVSCVYSYEIYVTNGSCAKKRSSCT